jgi:uncharacterized Zn finger protein (UPF0148 family)
LDQLENGNDRTVPIGEEICSTCGSPKLDFMGDELCPFCDIETDENGVVRLKDEQTN